jgi:hypothetical protein
MNGPTKRIAPASRAALVLLALAAVVAAATAGGCDDTDPTAPPPGEPVQRTFHFDEDMAGWLAVATDTLNPPIEWHVRHTTERARTGTGSVELHLANFNDQGKVWMERPFELSPGVVYQVDVEYAFATADWGDVNLFTVIAGVHPDPPRSAEDLTFQDDTGHGEGPDAGYVWQDRAYTFTAVAPGDSLLHVAIGVWGTWETARTYFVDDVSITFTPVG